MQEGFEKVDGGWLTSVVKDRFVVNYVRHEFDEAILELIDQINSPTLILGQNTDAWTQSHVAKWFAEARIHADIAKIYHDVDGLTLKQIFMLKTQSPEFFYQSLTKETNYRISTTDIAFFNAKLEMLFNQKDSWGLTLFRLFNFLFFLFLNWIILKRKLEKSIFHYEFVH